MFKKWDLTEFIQFFTGLAVHFLSQFCQNRLSVRGHATQEKQREGEGRRGWGHSATSLTVNFFSFTHDPVHKLVSEQFKSFPVFFWLYYRDSIKVLGHREKCWSDCLANSQIYHSLPIWFVLLVPFMKWIYVIHIFVLRIYILSKWMIIVVIY